MHSGKVRRISASGEIGVSRAVHCNAAHTIATAATQVAGVLNDLPGGADLGDEAVIVPAIATCLAGAGSLIDFWEVDRLGVARHVDITSAVYGDTGRLIAGTAPKVTGIPNHRVDD